MMDMVLVGLFLMGFAVTGWFVGPMVWASQKRPSKATIKNWPRS